MGNHHLQIKAIRLSKLGSRLKVETLRIGEHIEKGRIELGVIVQKLSVFVFPL